MALRIGAASPQARAHSRADGLPSLTWTRAKALAEVELGGQRAGGARDCGGETHGRWGGVSFGPGASAVRTRLPSASEIVTASLRIAGASFTRRTNADGARRGCA